MQLTTTLGFINNLPKMPEKVLSIGGTFFLLVELHHTQCNTGGVTVIEGNLRGGRKNEKNIVHKRNNLQILVSLTFLKHFRKNTQTFLI